MELITHAVRRAEINPHTGRDTWLMRDGDVTVKKRRQHVQFSQSDVLNTACIALKLNLDMLDKLEKLRRRSHEGEPSSYRRLILYAIATLAKVHDATCDRLHVLVVDRSVQI